MPGGGATAWSTRCSADRPAHRLSERPVRALYFGTYDRTYPRNAQVISALRGAGVEVVEAHTAVWGRHNWSVGIGQLARIAAGRDPPGAPEGTRR